MCYLFLAATAVIFRRIFALSDWLIAAYAIWIANCDTGVWVPSFTVRDLIRRKVFTARSNLSQCSYVSVVCSKLLRGKTVFFLSAAAVPDSRNFLLCRRHIGSGVGQFVPAAVRRDLVCIVPDC